MVYHLLYRELLGAAAYDEEEADEAAAEDWTRDSMLGAAMGRKAFMDAIFEVADMYTQVFVSCVGGHWRP